MLLLPEARGRNNELLEQQAYHFFLVNVGLRQLLPDGAQQRGHGHCGGLVHQHHGYFVGVVKENAVAGHLFVVNLDAVEVAVVVEHGARATFIQGVILPDVEKEQGRLVESIFLKINHDLPTCLDKENLNEVTRHGLAHQLGRAAAKIQVAKRFKGKLLKERHVKLRSKKSSQKTEGRARSRPGAWLFGGYSS